MTMFIPLHRYFIQAMDLMYAHLRNGRPLPPSQVVHTTPRGAGRAADHAGQRAADLRRSGGGCLDHLHGGPGEDSQLIGRAMRLPTRAV